jgi:hypothetical protein
VQRNKRRLSGVSGRSRRHVVAYDQRCVRWLSAIVLAAAAAGCDDGSGFAGMYETTAFVAQRDGCGGTQAAEMIPADEHWFRLDDVDGLVAYFACSGQDACDDVYDLTRSFGRADGDAGWSGTLASAIPGTTCMLRYQLRELAHAASGVEITTRRFEMSDATLAGPDCNAAAATMRAAAMPCVLETVQTAEAR